MLTSLLNHLAEHRWAYVLPALVSGVMVGVSGYTWLDDRIVSIVSAEIHSLEDQVQRIERRQLEQEIRDVKALLCRRPGDRQLISRLEDLQTDYRDLTGSRYEAPDCDLLIPD